MNHQTIVLLCAALLGLVASSRVFAAETKWTPTQMEIAALVRAWEVAALAGDVDAIMKLTAPGFTGWNLSQTLPVDRAAYEAEQAGFRGRFKTSKCALPVTAIRVDGDTAVAHGRYLEIVQESTGVEMQLQGSWTASLRRRGKQWLFLSVATLEDRPATDEAAIKLEVMKALDGFKVAVENVDLAGVLAIAADIPEFRYVQPDGAVVDFAGWKLGHIDYFATVSAHRLVEKSLQITVLSPDAALVTWQGMLEVMPKDGPVQRVDPFSATFVFKRLGGVWRLVHQHESTSPPQPSS